MEIINWLCENKDWIFSGIGITVMTLICVGIRKIFLKKNQNSKTMIKQINDGIKNTQVGIQNNYYIKEKDNE